MKRELKDGTRERYPRADGSAEWELEEWFGRQGDDVDGMPTHPHADRELKGC